MNGMLIFAIITITLALLFYTIGVFEERKSKNLKNVFFLWIFSRFFGIML